MLTFERSDYEEKSYLLREQLKVGKITSTTGSIQALCKLVPLYFFTGSRILDMTYIECSIPSKGVFFSSKNGKERGTQPKVSEWAMPISEDIVEKIKALNEQKKRVADLQDEWYQSHDEMTTIVSMCVKGTEKL